LKSGRVGYFDNGDGSYWKNNWLDSYEGRIYEHQLNRGSVGVEWWSMNCERYATYRQRLIEYEQKVDKAKREWEAAKKRSAKKAHIDRMKEKYEKLKAEGADSYAARSSKWDKVRKRYPELARFMEESFSGPLMRKDIKI